MLHILLNEPVSFKERKISVDAKFFNKKEREREKQKERELERNSVCGGWGGCGCVKEKERKGCTFERGEGCDTAKPSKRLKLALGCVDLQLQLEGY